MRGQKFESSQWLDVTVEIPETLASDKSHSSSDVLLLQDSGLGRMGMGCRECVALCLFEINTKGDARSNLPELPISVIIR